jgi:hypothetical protein
MFVKQNGAVQALNNLKPNKMKNEKQKIKTVALTGQPMIEWMMSRFNWTEKETLDHIAQQKNLNK